MPHLLYAVSLVLCLSPLAQADQGNDPIAEAIRTVRQVQIEGEGSTSAVKGWKTLAEADPSELPKILTGMKGTDPIVSNWLAAAVDSVFQRAEKASKPLPVMQLERFVLDPTQSGQGRTLAYDQLYRIDPSYRERLLPKLLGDPWSDLCQKAAQYAIQQAEALEKNDADKTEVIAAYQKILDTTRDLDQIHDLARRLDKLGQKVDVAAQLGFIVDWQIIGPFDGSGDDGFARVFEPEKQESFTFEETYQGKPAPDDKGKANGEAAKAKGPRTLRWMKYHTPHSGGRVNLNQVLCEEKGVTAYAVANFISKKDQEIELRMVSHNGLQAWVNGEQVCSLEFYHSGSQFDLYRVKAKLRQGKNTIVLKIRQNEQTQSWAKNWYYTLRVCDPIGYGIVSEDRE